MTTGGISWKLKWVESVFLFPEFATGRPAGQHTGGTTFHWGFSYQQQVINRQVVGRGQIWTRMDLGVESSVPRKSGPKVRTQALEPSELKFQPWLLSSTAV